MNSKTDRYVASSEVPAAKFFDSPQISLHYFIFCDRIQIDLTPRRLEEVSKSKLIFDAEALQYSLESTLIYPTLLGLGIGSSHFSNITVL